LDYKTIKNGTINDRTTTDGCQKRIAFFVSNAAHKTL
jgi:hypothetical protein